MGINLRNNFGIWICYFLLILITIQAALNIWRRFIPIDICPDSWLGIFQNPPSLLILLMLLYYWPILLRNRQLASLKSEHDIASQPKQSTRWLNPVLIPLTYLLLSLLGMMALLSPAIYDKYQIMLLGIVLVLFPFYSYHKFANLGNNYLTFVMWIWLVITLLSLLFLDINIININFILTVTIISLFAWVISGLSFWSNNYRKWLFVFNFYNSFSIQAFAIKYRRNLLLLMGWSGLAILLFLGYAYLNIPRVETFGIYREAFDRVVEMAKNNQLQYNGDKRWKIPCTYNYLSKNGNVRVIEEKDSLTLEFQIFSIGFGDGYTAFVYSNQPLHHKEGVAYVQVKQLGDSWYWGKWIW